jgi:hypothetical protein
MSEARETRRDLRFRRAIDAQAERHIRFHVHGRIQRIGLEHQRDAAVLGIGPGHVLAADFDLAGAGVDQACDTVQQRRFAAARWTEQHHELPAFTSRLRTRSPCCRPAGSANYE